MSVLEIRNLRLAIRNGANKTPVLRGVNLSIQAGQTCGLVGESGAGKTMITKALLGVLPRSARHTGGDILFDGVNVLSLSARKHRALLGTRITLIPQDPMVALNPVKTIGKHFRTALRRHHSASDKALNSLATSLLDDVLMPRPDSVLNQYPHELSGGMRQRALIAMAFSGKPSLIIADEPTTALDVTVQKRVLGVIKRMQAAHNTAILFVTHDLGVVAKLCDTVYVMHAGRIVEDGTCHNIIHQPQSDYTRALLKATPRFDKPSQSLIPVDSRIETTLWKDALALDRHYD